MSLFNKFLVTLIICASFVVLVEIIFLNKMPQPKLKGSACTSCITPTPTLDLPRDQSYRLPDAPNRLTRFLTKALFDFLTELSDYNPTKSVNVKVDSLYEGKIEAVYQGKDAEKIHPPDPKFPKRTVVAIIDITDSHKVANSNKTISIQLVNSELPYLTIMDISSKKLGLNDIKGKQVRINRIIELPVVKNVDIVTLSPIVYTNIVVLD